MFADDCIITFQKDLSTTLAVLQSATFIPSKLVIKLKLVFTLLSCIVIVCIIKYNFAF